MNYSIMEASHVVIDLETVGLLPTSGILSIGAVSFSPKDVLEKNIIVNDFYINVDIESCIDKGMTFDWDTIMWWMMQDSRAGESLQEDRKDIRQALHKLNNFLLLSNFDYVWANPNMFDISILNNAYRLCKVIPGWNRKQIRDLMTLEGITEKTEYIDQIELDLEDLEHGMLKHNALYDAKVEAHRISNSLGLISCPE